MVAFSSAAIRTRTPRGGLSISARSPQAAQCRAISEAGPSRPLIPNDTWLSGGGKCPRKSRRYIVQRSSRAAARRRSVSILQETPPCRNRGNMTGAAASIRRG